jgi:Transglycosylase SLT domain
VPRQSDAITPARKTRKRRKRRFGLSKFWPSARLRRRWFRAFRRASPTAQLVVVISVVFAVWLALNWAYQVIRKPSELFFPVSGALYKTPYETWQEYAPIFRAHATNVVTPELLAALAQVEGSGNPVVRTYWRWSLRRKPFEVYRPASSAVGMYQITDGTFAEARRYCIHDHAVVEDGPWNDFRSCWFNSLYTRVVPSHAVELTSAYLDRSIANTLKRLRIADATLQQKQDLAAVIHLCGAGAGDVYARRRFRLISGQRCGDHDVQAYVARFDAMKRVFARIEVNRNASLRR